MIQTEELKTRLRHEIESSNGSLLKKFPVETYLALLGRYPGLAGYHYISPEVTNYTENILKKSDSNTLELYHQLVLVELISRNAVEKQDLPDAIKQLYIKNFNRILNSISTRSERPGFYLYPNDKFFKDLAVCTGKMIPVETWRLVVSSFPIKFIFKRGVKQFLRGLSFMLFDLNGVKSLVFQSHLDSRDPDLMKEFNMNGRIRYYLNVADLLKLNKKIKGIYGVSWLYDPILEVVSPRLAFLRKIVVDNGGKLFYLGPSERATRDALTKSYTRNKLYNEGKYVPTDYLIVWSRRRLIEWADRVSSLPGKDA